MRQNERMQRYKLAVLVSHPIQYQTPLFRKIADHPKIDIMVYFCSDRYVKETIELDLGISFKWDVPLLKGYKYKLLPNLSPKCFSSFFGQINPSIVRELRRNQYDAVWVHGYASLTNWLAFCGAWVARTPLLIRGESHLMNYRPLWKRAIKRAGLFLLFKGISAFLPIGSLNKVYYQYYGVSDDKMFLSPYAVNNEFFSKKYHEIYHKREYLKKELDIHRELPVVLYASKMTPRKRAMDLLRAHEKIQKEIDVALVFVGDGVERLTLENYTKSHNLKNVYFVGFKNQTELPDYFVIADIFVLPSTDEPWGLIINEAMNFGLPIITTDKVGAAPDLVKNGENGFIYSVGDIEKLASLLLKLLQEPDLRENMGKRSLEIIDKWSYKEDIEGILAALEYTRKN